MTPEFEKRIKLVRAGKVPTGYKKTKVGIVPKEWALTSLKDVAVHVTEKNKGNAFSLTLTNSATKGVIKQTEYFDKQISNKENVDGYYIVRRGDYVYNPRISGNAPCGPINRSHIEETGIASPLYTVFRINKNFHDEFYLEMFLKSHFWHRYMRGIANYGARHDRMSVTNDDLFAMPLPVPPIGEQKKIAEILATQDKVIELKGKLIAEKRKQKLSLEKKLFSDSDAHNAKIFFINGVKIEKNKWKQIFLRELGVFSKGSGISREESCSGNIPAIRYGEIYTVHNEYIKQFYSFVSAEVAKQSKRLKIGDLLFTSSGETREDIGKCVAFCMNCEAYAGGDVVVLSPLKPCNSIFWGFLLNSNSVVKQRCKYGQGDSVVHISADSLGKICISCPTLDEQNAIATCLVTMDEEISLLQKELELEKLKKKSLMQLLLTGLVRVGA